MLCKFSRVIYYFVVFIVLTGVFRNERLHRVIGFQAFYGGFVGTITAKAQHHTTGGDASKRLYTEYRRMSSTRVRF